MGLLTQECKFYSYIASKWAVNQFDNEYERELYNKSLKKMIRFKEVNKMVIGLESFTWNLKTLYLDLQRNITNNNFTSRKMEVNQVVTVFTQILLHDIREMVVKYIALVDALKEYPEWQHKVKEEPGHYIHLIHNNLQEAEKAWLFEGFVIYIRHSGQTRVFRMTLVQIGFIVIRTAGPVGFPSRCPRS